MNGILNENQLSIVKKYEFDKPLFRKIDSINVNCIRDCHIKFFHTSENKCEYDIELTKMTNNEIINITFSDKSLGLYELNKKLTITRQNGFIFNQIKKPNDKILLYLISFNYTLILKTTNYYNALSLFQKTISKS